MANLYFDPTKFASDQFNAEVDAIALIIMKMAYFQPDAVARYLAEVNNRLNTALHETNNPFGDRPFQPYEVLSEET